MGHLHDVGDRGNIGKVVVGVVEVQSLETVPNLPTLHQGTTLDKTLDMCGPPHPPLLLS